LTALEHLLEDKERIIEVLFYWAVFIRKSCTLPRYLSLQEDKHRFLILPGGFSGQVSIFGAGVIKRRRNSCSKGDKNRNLNSRDL